jgi:phosphatidylserine/phosphatidylglycerophosphate/cardiolipin synthase-like enzyme
MPGRQFLNLSAVALAAFAVACSSHSIRVRTPAGDAVPIPIGVFANSVTPTIFQVIGGAQKSIDIEIYEMKDPNVTQALRQAMDKGVIVRIVKEPTPIGQLCDPWGVGFPDKNAAKIKDPAARAATIADCLDQQKLVQDVRTHGGAYEKFAKAQLCGQDKKTKNCFQHGKIIIADQADQKKRIALISSGNFNASNLCDLSRNPDTCNRDYTVTSQDPITVATLEEVFENDLKGVRYDLRTIANRQELTDRLTVSPFSLDPLKSLLMSAQTSVQLQNQYIHADSDIPDVLIALSHKGVNVELQVADVCLHGPPPDKQAYQLFLEFAALENAGVKVRMFNKAHKIDGKPGYLHAKSIVVDGNHAWVGSVNGSATSLNENREFGVYTRNPAQVKSLSQTMRQDFSDSTSQTWRDSLKCHNVGFAAKDISLQSGDADYLAKLKAGGTSPSPQNQTDDQNPEGGM